MTFVYRHHIEPRDSKTVTEAKSNLYGQLIGIRQNLVKNIVESPNFNTSSIWDEWYC